YVPMFGETDYDPSRQYGSVAIEEQLDALGKAVDSGKVNLWFTYANILNLLLVLIWYTYAGLHKYCQKVWSLSCISCNRFICSSFAAFVLIHPLVASAVFGATKVWQLREVVEACKVHLTSEMTAEINKVHARCPNPCP
ncbi:hypothetical protein BHM03_00029023, partial [Ensete ventricosum]